MKISRIVHLSLSIVAPFLLSTAIEANAVKVVCGSGSGLEDAEREINKKIEIAQKAYEAEYTRTHRHRSQPIDGIIWTPSSLTVVEGSNDGAICLTITSDR